MTTHAVDSKEASNRRQVWFYGIYNYYFYKVCDCGDLSRSFVISGTSVTVPAHADNCKTESLVHLAIKYIKPD